jgi:hypothetical protein
MVVDDEGNLWVQPTKKKEGGKTFTAVDIFDPEVYTSRVWLDIFPRYSPVRRCAGPRRTKKRPQADQTLSRHLEIEADLQHFLSPTLPSKGRDG